MNIEKGQIHQMVIEDMSQEGTGIGKLDGLAVFVENAIVGDTIKAELTKLKKNYAFGRMTEIVEPSAKRIVPPCKYAEKCGGCSLQNMDYSAQLDWKQNLVREKMTRLGSVENPLIYPAIGMEDPWRYRNKAQFPVGQGIVGFYQAKSHRLINCDPCLIQSEPADAAARTLRSFMKSDHVTAYDEKTGKGLFRHMIVKTGFQTGEVMVILVINGKGIPNGEKLVYLLDDAISELPVDPKTGVEYSLESVIININKKKTSEILGEQCITLAGKPTILERVGTMQFEISPMSFYQINPEQMIRLYDKALEYAALTGTETVFDLYCGIGTIGLYCADKAQKIIGIESVKSAVLDANRNAVINGIVNAEYICGKAEEELPKLIKEGITADVVILDPPRAGCEPALLEAVANANPDRIVYVSCDPATLARDVKILGELGYAFVEAQPVDMFPHTGHVEAIILMTRSGSGDKK